MAAAIQLITGKGGTGRTTHALALGLAWAARGARVRVVELGSDGGLERAAGDASGDRVSLGPEGALATFLDAHLPSRRLAKVASGNALLAALFAAAPGTVEIAQLDALERWSSEGRLDRIVIDGEATGHTLLWLELPRVFAGLGAAGVVGARLERIEAMLADPQRFVVHAAMLPRALVEKETRALGEGLAARGVARGALFATIEPHHEVSTDALREARTACAATPAAEDLAFELAARERTEAMLAHGACGFSRLVQLPWIERDETWIARLTERGEAMLRALEAP